MLLVAVGLSEVIGHYRHEASEYIYYIEHHPRIMLVLVTDALAHNTDSYWPTLCSQM